MTVLNTMSEGNEKDGKRAGKATKPKMMLVEKPVYEELALSAIIVDPELQSRVAMDMEHVRMLGKRREDGLPIEPPIVFKDETDPKRVRYLLADGFHRHLDAKKAGLASMKVEIKIGTRRDALIYSAGANQKFSLPRKPEDIKKAVFMLLADEEWWKKSDVLIAGHCGISGGPVRKWRTEYAVSQGVSVPSSIVMANGRERRRPLPDSQVSKCTSLSRTGYKKIHYSASVDGQAIPLGADPGKAESKLASILKEKADKSAKLQSAGHLIIWLSARLVYGETAPRRNNGVSGILGDGWAVAITQFKECHDTVLAVGRALVLRGMYRPGGRAVVVCYPEDGYSDVIEAARQLGVEFLTPDEFVASVKGDDAQP